MKPVRLQLSRRKGFNLQALSLETNGLPAVVVRRPTKLGNPFTIAMAIETGYARDEDDARGFVCDCFEDWLSDKPDRNWWQGPESDERRAYILAAIPTMRGHNIACTCRLDQRCHGDLYLKLANPS